MRRGPAPIGWLAAPLLLGCSAAAAPAAFPAYDPGSLRIALHRHYCPDACVDYRIIILGSGDVTYEGSGPVLVSGTHRSHMSPEAVRALAARFEAVGFFDLDNVEPRAGETSRGDDSLSFAMSGQARSLRDRRGFVTASPGPVTGLVDAVDEASGAFRWYHGNSETVPALHAEGYDFRSAEVQRMLAAAASDGTVEVVGGLLRAGVPATASGPQGTAIEVAAGNGHVEIWRLLVDAGALRGADRDLVGRLAEAATVLGHPEILRDLQPFHFDPNGPELDPLLLNVVGGAGGGSRSDRLELLRMLLAAGADPDRANESGDTALLLVRDVEMARLLLDAGADIDQRNAVGETVAMLLPAEREDLALFYLDREADPSIRSEFGQTLADRARINHWPRVLARLNRR